MASTLYEALTATSTPIPSMKVSSVRQIGYMKQAVVLDVSDPTCVGSCTDLSTCAVILTHRALNDFNTNVASALLELRKIEKESKKPIFTILSLTHMSGKSEEDILDACKLVYSSGFDGILVAAPEKDADEYIRFIRSEALGQRGRRVKILIDDFKRGVCSICEIDGAIIRSDLESADLLARQKLVFTSSREVADFGKVDVLVSPTEELLTPATSEPSSPQSTYLAKNFLMNEVLKFLVPSTRLIIALSDEGQSVSELSVQSRLIGRRLPMIMGLSAAESVCRYMGCLYGVVALQTPSFISVSSVVKNAIDCARERGLVEAGDQVLVVLHPPPVTASTNETCFDGVVQSRVVE